MLKKEMTICFLIKEEGEKKRVCLAEKKVRYRVGRLNGYGGKLEKGETYKEGAMREVWEESGVKPLEIEEMGHINFCDPGVTHSCRIFTSKRWEGDVKETEEMRPFWFDISNIPFKRMGQADKFWIPEVLSGNKVEADFYYDEENNLYKKIISINED